MICFNQHIDSSREEVDGQQSALAKKTTEHATEDKSNIETSSGGEDKQIVVLFNPMTNYSPMQWDNKNS